MAQIALVSNQHDYYVGVGMVPQLLEPPGHVLVGLMLADVVDEQGPDGSAVVGRSDGAVALLACRVPDLSLDGFGVDLDGAGGELDADGRLGVEVELVAGESTKQVGLSDTRVSNQHHCIRQKAAQVSKGSTSFQPGMVHAVQFERLHVVGDGLASRAQQRHEGIYHL